MTTQELNSVRDLKKKIRGLEKYLRSLRLSAENITPIIDGLPHAKSARSRVEKYAVLIAENEQELEKLQAELIKAQSELADKILCEFEHPQTQMFLVLRYIECLSYEATAERMQITLRHAFRIHAKITKCHIAAQNQS